MATYTYKGEGYSLPYDAPGMQIVRRRLDIPDLIANGGLALASAPSVPTSLAATGFAQTDILDIFHFPKGTLVKRVCARIVTPEGGTLTIDVGVTGADADGFLDGSDMNGSAGTVYYTLDSLGYGTDNALGYFFAADGAVSILFNNAADTLVADFWAEAAFVAEI